MLGDSLKEKKRIIRILVNGAKSNGVMDSNQLRTRIISMDNWNAKSDLPHEKKLFPGITNQGIALLISPISKYRLPQLRLWVDIIKRFIWH